MSCVLARNNLQRGKLSRAFHITELNNDHSAFCNNDVYLDTDEEGFICPSNLKTNLPIQYFLNTELASDVQSKNIELLREGGRWRFKLIKDVAAGEKLQLWFSEDVLVTLGMPFLTPKNIQGRKSYVCHDCNILFEQPNYLKLHLLLSCEEYSRKKFWKLVQLRFQENIPLNLSTNDIFFKSTNINLERPKSQENSRMSNQSNSFRCYSEPPFSAFRPYRFLKPPEHLLSKLNNNSHLGSVVMHRLQLPNSMQTEFEMIQRGTAWWNQIDNRVSDLSKSLEHVTMINPAEVEAFATNWGKSKEGHLCVYCGKVYSRKYGLKIHIRTHTGYKPLQCKYCLRPFGDPSNLNKHVRLHAQCDTPHKCNLCGKMLVRRRDLVRHLKSFHGEKSLEDCNLEDSSD